MGDPDCDGNPGSPSAALIANNGEDLPVLDKGEFAVVLLNFANENNTIFTGNLARLQDTIVALRPVVPEV